jgi:hypothetical protein
VLTGLHGLQQGIGLELVPYLLGSHRYERHGPDDEYELEGGGEIKYHITPNLSASLSYNTDFAETEADSRQINLTRFPLFFPEKRSFFLEDAGIFDFGDLGTELIPFFSRRIGLSDSGEIVPIIAAGKLSGRINSYNIGVVDAVVDDHAGLDEKNAFAARTSKNVLDHSSIGFIGTAGDPNADNGNFMGGFDYCYHTSELFGDHLFEWNSFGLASSTEHAARDNSLAYGTELVLPNDSYYARAQVYQIEKNFNAALGFVPRRGIRGYESTLRYKPRPESIDRVRQLFFTYTTRHETDLSNELDTASHSITPLYILFESGDEVFCGYKRIFDAPDEDFEISEGVVIPADRYWWDAYTAGFETASKRAVELSYDFRGGEFYKGTRYGHDTDITFRFSKFFSWSVGYEYNAVDLPEGDFDTHLGRVRAQVNVTPDLNWYNLLQYDNVSDSIGFNSRIVWEYTPGANVFLVLNQNINTDRSRYRVEQSKFTVKINYTFRF